MPAFDRYSSLPSILLGLALALAVRDPARPQGVAASHCDPTEQVLFNCPITKSSKVLSLCASKALAPEQGTLAYRFGRIGQVELQFPHSPAQSLQQFRYAHYSRAQVDRTEVTFANGSATYAVFDYFDGDEKIKVLRGVRITTPDGSKDEVELRCRAPVKSALQKLENVIPCDTDNALASCR